MGELVYHPEQLLRRGGERSVENLGGGRQVQRRAPH